MLGIYSQLARLFRSLKVFVDIIALQFSLVRKLEQTEAKSRLVKHEHFVQSPSHQKVKTRRQITPNGGRQETQTREDQSQPCLSPRVPKFCGKRP